jgi:hypothetical protein
MPGAGWNKYAFKKAEELIGRHEISTVITTGPPHSTHLVGLKLKKELRLNGLPISGIRGQIYIIIPICFIPQLLKRIDRRRRGRFLKVLTG